MNTWRAGCGGTRTSGSGVRTGETTRRKADTASRSDTHYWAVDLLQELGARVHLVNPKALNWGECRVKNDVADATDLADMLRLGRLPEAWIAPPAIRELRELVRYRAKLVKLRSGLKAQVHAVMAKEAVLPAVGDMFGVAGNAQLDAMALGRNYASGWSPCGS